MATLYVSEFSGVLPDGNGNVPQAVQTPPLAEQTVDISGTHAESNAFDARTAIVRVIADSVCSITVGVSPVATTGMLRMAADSPEYFKVAPGQKISVIANVYSTYVSSRFKLPAGISSLPISLLNVRDDRSVITNKSVSQAFQDYNAAIWSSANTYYVKPSTGSDANAGTSIGAPFATLSQAVRTAAAGSRIVCLESFTETPFSGPRNSDASQTSQQAKLIDANGFTVTISPTGPTLSTQTFTQDGTFTNCWTTTLTLSGSATFERLLRTDVLDDYGYASPFTKYTSAAALNSASGDGWYWDNAGKVLWVKLGAGTNVQTNRAILKGLYTDSGGTSRILVIGAAICFVGVRFEGVQFVTLDGGGRLPQIWLQDCVQLWSNGKGADLTACGLHVTQNHLCYSSQADGLNGYATSTVSKGLLFNINSRFIRAGDRRVFTADNTLQGVSAHGGSNHVSWGCQFIENNGQGVADTCANSSADVTWLVSCTATGGQSTAANFEFGSAATSASRTAYLDTCTSLSAPAAGDVSVGTNATAYAFNSSLPVVGVGSVTAYLPWI